MGGRAELKSDGEIINSGEISINLKRYATNPLAAPIHGFPSGSQLKRGQ